MAADAFLGVDIGTTSTQGVLIDASGGVHAEASRSATLHSDHPNWAEMDPAAWWANARAIARELTDAARSRDLRVAAVGISGMVPTLVLLDADGEPLRPSIQQNDARTTVELDELRARFDGARFFELSGGSINQQVMAPKLRWLARHEPRVLEQARHLLGSYDYVTYRLTGTLGVERNWALESGLCDLERGTWDPELVDLAGIDPGLLLPIRASHEIVGTVTPAAAAATGLSVGVPVVAGVADHVASAFAAGVVDAGDLLIKFGGAGDVLYATPRRVTDPRLFIDHHVVPDRYLLNGCMATSGSMLQWVVAELFTADRAAAEAAGHDVYAVLDRRASALPPGSGGVVVLPYFLGEKTPLHDPHARGTIVGLGLHHGRDALYRASLEAVTFGFRHHLEVLRERDLPIARVLASDGGAKSDLWLQIAANVLGLPVHRVGRHPGSSLGAAFVAAYAVGAVPGWDAIGTYVDVLPPFEPEAEAVSIYDEAYGAYRATYEGLRTVFPLLGRVAARGGGGAA